MGLNLLRIIKKRIQALFSYQQYTQPLRVNAMKQFSQENLEMLQDRLSFLSLVINDQSKRMAHITGVAREYGPQIVQSAMQELLKEKVALELQIDTLARHLNE